jgi:hypothetical protein
LEPLFAQGQALSCADATTILYVVLRFTGRSRKPLLNSLAFLMGFVYGKKGVLWFIFASRMIKQFAILKSGLLEYEDVDNSFTWAMCGYECENGVQQTHDWDGYQLVKGVCLASKLQDDLP